MKTGDVERTEAEVLRVWAAVVAAVEADDFRCHDAAACPYCSGRWAAPWDNNGSSGTPGVLAGSSSSKASYTVASYTDSADLNCGPCGPAGSTSGTA